MKAVVICLAVVFLGYPVDIAAQPAPRPTPPERYTAPIEMYKTGLGRFTRPISSTNKEAQAFFDQGFQMMFAFAKPEAVRSFREAWERDPNCAICYGVKRGRGVLSNGPMNAEQAPTNIQRFRKQSGEESRNGEGTRFHRCDDGPLRRAIRSREARRTGQSVRGGDGTIAARYPDDLEAATLYADACFFWSPAWHARHQHRIGQAPSPRARAGACERMFHHPCACHLYVHATESTVVPQRAEACARSLENPFLAPAISHMPSQTWN